MLDYLDIQAGVRYANGKGFKKLEDIINQMVMLNIPRHLVEASIERAIRFGQIKDVNGEISLLTENDRREALQKVKLNTRKKESEN